MLNRTLTIRGENGSDVWLKLLGTLVNSPNVLTSAPRGLGIRELIDVTLILTDATRPVVAVPARRLNYHFMVAEFFWIATGCDDVESIAHYNPGIARFSDDGKTFFGAYGPRWTRQLDSVLERLRKDRDSRQAVINIWRVNPGSTRDVPCTLSMQYLIRDDQLHALVTMRSSDVWLGVPYDIFNFSRLAAIVAGELDLPLGELHMRLGSSHLYDSNFDAAMNVLLRSMQLESPALPPLVRLPNGALEWWRLARDGSLGTTAEPWFTYLAPMADRAVRRSVPNSFIDGVIGKLMMDIRTINRGVENEIHVRDRDDKLFDDDAAE